MHPHIQYEFMQARVADLHREAHRASIARTARQARRHGGTPRPGSAALAQRLPAAVRGWRIARRPAT